MDCNNETVVGIDCHLPDANGGLLEAITRPEMVQLRKIEPSITEARAH